MIRDAEHSKARMYDLSGESPMDFNLLDSDCRLREFKIDLRNEYVHSSMVDESYQLISSHLDQLTQERIINGEYIDFA